MFDYLIEKLYYKLNPGKVWKYSPGLLLKKSAPDTQGVLQGGLSRLPFQTTTHNNYEYVKVNSIDENNNTYSIDYYLVSYGVYDNSKSVKEKLGTSISKKHFEDLNYHLVSSEAFNNGVKK